jgi:SAM-dependent methyltransferase
VAAYQVFDAVAEEYDAVRPDYPAQLFDALESAMGQPLLWSQVCDVGCGTGIASRALAGRGATVTAVDPGIGALRVLRSRSTSRVRPVVGAGEALPLADSVVDLLTYAQAFHWVEPAAAIGEAFRVLKPGGLLALWWNEHDETVAWFAEHRQRFFAAIGDKPEFRSHRYADVLAGPPWRRRVATVTIPWSRRISLRDFGRDLATRSYVLNVAPERRQQVLDEELQALARDHPDGYLVEPYSTYAVFARN